MSWDDIKIGEGDSLNSATGIDGYDGVPRVSQNRVSYWISEAYLGLGITIMKNTPEADVLRQLLEIAIKSPNPTTNAAVEYYIADLVLSRATGSTIQRAVEEAMTNAYERGSRDRAKTIRDALGVSDLLRY